MVFVGRDGRTQYQLDNEIKSGGEGSVYTIKGKPNSVAKIYKQERLSDVYMREKTKNKILAMLDMKFYPYYNGRLIVAWPEDILYDKNGVFCGFVMPKIANMKSLIWAIRPSDRDILWPQGYRWHYSIAIAFNLSLIIEYLHNAGKIMGNNCKIVVGDMNTNNILVDAKGNVALIDADSFDITDKDGKNYECMVGFPEVLPPELQGKDFSIGRSLFSEKTDCFSLAIHIFHMLCNNCHPFGCSNYTTVHGSSSQPDTVENILKGYCPYVTGATTKKTVSDALDIDVFSRELRDLIDRTFSYNSTTAIKQTTIKNRPSAHEWREALGKLYNEGVSICKYNSLHEYPKSYHVGCPWCAIEGKTPSKKKRLLPFLSKIKRILSKPAKIIGIVLSMWLFFCLIIELGGHLKIW